MRFAWGAIVGVLFVFGTVSATFAAPPQHANGLGNSGNNSRASNRTNFSPRVRRALESRDRLERLGGLENRGPRLKTAQQVSPQFGTGRLQQNFGRKTVFGRFSNRTARIEKFEKFDKQTQQRPGRRRGFFSALSTNRDDDDGERTSRSNRQINPQERRFLPKAERLLNKRLADIDHLRDVALANGNVRLLEKADELEALARRQYERRIGETGDEPPDDPGDDPTGDDPTGDDPTGDTPLPDDPTLPDDPALPEDPTEPEDPAPPEEPPVMDDPIDDSPILDQPVSDDSVTLSFQSVSTSTAGSTFLSSGSPFRGDQVGRTSLRTFRSFPTQQSGRTTVGSRNVFGQPQQTSTIPGRQFGVTTSQNARMLRRDFGQSIMDQARTSRGAFGHSIANGVRYQNPHTGSLQTIGVNRNFRTSANSAFQPLGRSFGTTTSEQARQFRRDFGETTQNQARTGRRVFGGSISESVRPQSGF